MPAKSCRVTIRDLSGTDHTVTVTASTLYEAVAQGMAALRGKDWVAGIADGNNTIKVTVVDVPVEHHVKVGDFHSWLAKQGRTPREITERIRIREILGMATPRA